MGTVQTTLWVVVLLVMLALVFDFMNGFHDAANSIATVVSTGVLKPGQAILFAAFFNVIAIFVFQLSVAATVGKGIVQPGVVDTHVVFGALVGAITWNVITWYYGIPSSSSHALIGGIVGAVIAKAGARPWDRDDIDRRILADTIEGRGEVIDSEQEVGGYPTHPETRQPFVEADWDLATMEPLKPLPKREPLR